MAKCPKRKLSKFSFANSHFLISIIVFSCVGLYSSGDTFNPRSYLKSLLGGLLFGLLLGSFVVVVAATVGASIVFFAVRTALGDPLKTKAKGSIEKMRRGFEKNIF